MIKISYAEIECLNKELLKPSRKSNHDGWISSIKMIFYWLMIRDRFFIKHLIVSNPYLFFISPLQASGRVNMQ